MKNRCIDEGDKKMVTDTGGSSAPGPRSEEDILKEEKVQFK